MFQYTDIIAFDLNLDPNRQRFQVCVETESKEGGKEKVKRKKKGLIWKKKEMFRETGGDEIRLIVIDSDPFSEVERRVNWRG